MDGASVVEGDGEGEVVGVEDVVWEGCAVGEASASSLEVSVLEDDVGSDAREELVVVSAVSSEEDEVAEDADGTLEM